jgi:hypothetical protein
LWRAIGRSAIELVGWAVRPPLASVAVALLVIALAPVMAASEPDYAVLALMCVASEPVCARAEPMIAAVAPACAASALM